VKFNNDNGENYSLDTESAIVSFISVYAQNVSYDTL